MSADEIAGFENSPYFRDAGRVRRWDEAGKVVGMKTRSIREYMPLLQRVVDRHMQAGLGQRRSEATPLVTAQNRTGLLTCIRIGVQRI
jgi:hypothetical protein